MCIGSAGPSGIGVKGDKDLKLFEILRPHGLSLLATPRLRSRRQHTAFGWEALLTTPVRWEITPANEKLVARPTKFRTR